MSPLFIQLTQGVNYSCHPSRLCHLVKVSNLCSVIDHHMNGIILYAAKPTKTLVVIALCMHVCMSIPIRFLLSSSVSFFLNFFCCWSSAPCIKCKLFSSPITIFTFKFKIDDLVIWMLVIWILNASYIRHDLMLNSCAEWKNMPHLDQLL